MNILLAVVLGVSAYAVDFSGSWQGSGKMISRGLFGQNRESLCSSIEVLLEHRTESLTIRHYRAVCQELTSDWGPSVMEIRDGRIYEDGEETGTLEGDTLTTLERSGTVQYAFNLRLRETPPGVAPKLETYYGVRSGMGAIVVEGELGLR